MAKLKPTPEKLLVMLVVEVGGDVEECISRLKRQKDEQFPLINGSCIGADGHYNVKCLGVKKVTRLRTAMLRRG